MSGALVTVSVLLIVWAVFLLVRNVFYRSYDPISLRNFFVFGYVYFLGLSGIFLLRGLDAGWFRLDSGYLPTSEGVLKLALLSPLFFGMFLIAAHLGFRMRGVQRMIPQLNMEVTTVTIWASVIPLITISLLFSVVGTTGYIGLLGSQFAIGTAAAAFGLSLYYAVARKWNPLAWALVGVILLAGLVASTVGGSGRRFMLSVLLVAPWVLYFAKLRYLPAMRFGVPSGIAAVLVVLLVLMYTGSRHDEDRDASSRLRQLVQSVTSPTITMTTLHYTLYTDTAYNTMFILESYPETFGYQPLHGAYWLVVNPIPRTIWPGKPGALGEALQTQMQATANLGPGIIGHGWSEAGVIGVLYYALFFGLLLGILDRSLAERATNPFFVVMLGGNLGNVIALPRGDTPLFLIQWIASAVAVFAVLRVVQVVAGPLARSAPSLLILPHGMGAVCVGDDDPEAGVGLGGHNGIGSDFSGADGVHPSHHGSMAG